MSRPLGRAVILLAVAACTRTEAPSPASGAPPSARASVSPAASAAVALASTGSLPGPLLPPAPPAPRCFLDGFAISSGALAEEAERALAAGESERALGCADGALRLEHRLVPALAARAGALAALGRVEEAQLAWARALAVDPEDPASLLGAADLHVRRLGPARESLELGLEYAVRGVRIARARGDRLLGARFDLVAAMAENDLGRSDRALPRLERAVAALPRDADAAYELGVALFELCRFDAAQLAFERALALAPDDPWALHHLGLLAERRGDAQRSRSLLARARRLAPDDFPQEVPVDAAAFRAEVAAAVAALSPEERRALEAVPIDVEELPDPADLLAVDPPLSPSILGLFRGPSAAEPCTPADGPRCRSIVFYRKNLVRLARDRGELSHQVRVTLLHELGHLNGEDDEDLRARGLE
jgi:tetratricopeptide (TPR) repeat protein